MAWSATGTLDGNPVLLVWDDGPAAGTSPELAIVVESLAGTAVIPAPGLPAVDVDPTDGQSWIAVMAAQGTLDSMTGEDTPLLAPPLAADLVG